MKIKVLIPFLALAILIGLVGLACGPNGGTATQPPIPPTNQQQQPTNPPPPPTSPPVPTATPDLAATQAALATEAVAAKYNEVKAQLDKLGIPSDTGYLGWVQTEPVSISLDQPNTYDIKAYAEGVTASDFVIQYDMTFITDSWPDCGILYRAEADLDRGAQYWFRALRFSGLPLFEIDFWDKGDRDSKITGDPRSSSDLKAKSGVADTFLLRIEGNQFTVFINEVRQGRYIDFNSRASTGGFGIYAMQNAGTTTCKFDNAWIWIYR